MRNRPQQDDYSEPHSHRATGRGRSTAGVAVSVLAALAFIGGTGWYVLRETGTTSTSEGPAILADDSPAPRRARVTTTPVPAPVKATPKPSSPRPSTRTPTRTPSSTPTKARTTKSATPTRKPTRSVAPTRAPKPPNTTRPTSTRTTTTSKPPAGGSGSLEAQVLTLTNAERKKAGCGPLRTNSALTRAAEGHAIDMVLKHYFDHTSLDGRSPFDRMRAAGFNGSAMAENIAVGYKSAAAVVEGWMNSEGHRKNILNCTYTMIGVGYDPREVKPDWSSGSWVQNFGA